MYGVAIISMLIKICHQHPNMKYLMPEAYTEGKDGFGWLLKQFAHSDVIKHCKRLFNSTRYHCSLSRSVLAPIVSDAQSFVSQLGTGGTINPFTDLDQVCLPSPLLDAGTLTSPLTRPCSPSPRASQRAVMSRTCPRDAETCIGPSRGFAQARRHMHLSSRGSRRPRASAACLVGCGYIEF